MSKETILYGGPDDENLIYDDPDKYIESYLDAIVDAESPDGIPEDFEVTVCTYIRTRVSITEYVGDPLCHVLETLDETYGGPDDPTEPTQKMIDAENKFIEAVIAEYEPWACEEKKELRKEVKALDWIKEHRPDWLKDAKV